jgi:hypothetical protein
MVTNLGGTTIDGFIARPVSRWSTGTGVVIRYRVCSMRITGMLLPTTNDTSPTFGANNQTPVGSMPLGSTLRSLSGWP